ncbi:MAG: alginate lyase family protein, partial [Blastocatellia bacterium]|nr:alginate lyase family protein [Blastocatellia bacterium]
MAVDFKKLKKLRGRSTQELRDRAKQEWTKLSERILYPGRIELSDTGLLRELRPSLQNGGGEASAEPLANRISKFKVKAFSPAFAQREEIREIMEKRFSAERIGIIGRAERIARGRFDLLGLTDLNFGDPIDWRAEPTSKKCSPLLHWSKIDYLNPDVTGDKKVTWELNRHQFLVTLGQAYWLTGDERYAEIFVSLVSSWIDANPLKRGINWVSSLELAFRAISWLWALNLFASSKRLTPQFLLRVLKQLVAHGRHIESYLSRYFSPNTHLTGEALGLFYLGEALPELRCAGDWRNLGLNILLEQLPVQVRSDGVYFEQSTYYHRYTADFYLHLLALAQANGVKLPDEVREKLAQLLDYLLWITRPDGTSPLIGDDDGGRLLVLGTRALNDYRDTLAAGAALLRRSDWKIAAGDAAVETLWLLGPEGLADYDNLKPEAPREIARAFDLSGYFVMRDGWTSESGYVLINCGPLGAPLTAGHSHADALSFEFAAAGRSWLIDPGTFAYTGDKAARDEFRTTAAHNTATVDGKPQSVPGGPFSWGAGARATAESFIPEADWLYFKGSHDGYQRLDDPVTHTRTIFFVKSDPKFELPAYLFIHDRFEATGVHRYALRFHFPPDCRLAARKNQLRATAAGGDELLIQAYGSSARRVEVEDGWVSRCYGHRERSPVAVIEADGVGPQEFVTIVIPAIKEAEIKIERESESSTSLSVSAGDVRDVILLGNETDYIGSNHLSGICSLGWGRFLRGKLARAGLIRGNLLEAEGASFCSPTKVESCALRLDSGDVWVSVPN